jgi:hypothetical protein
MRIQSSVIFGCTKPSAEIVIPSSYSSHLVQKLCQTASSRGVSEIGTSLLEKFGALTRTRKLDDLANVKC